MLMRVNWPAFREEMKEATRFSENAIAALYDYLTLKEGEDFVFNAYDIREEWEEFKTMEEAKGRFREEEPLEKLYRVIHFPGGLVIGK